MPFIQQLKRIYSIQEYFWSAEPQENGNIHFHLLIDRWVNAEGVNDLWNVATDHLGYLSKYVANSGNLRPPSTQIKACPKDMSLVKYVLKYVSKQPEIRCSLKLENGKKVKRVSFWEHEDLTGKKVELLESGVDLESDSYSVVGEKVFRYYERRRIEGRSWGMSDGIRDIDIYSQPVSYRVRDLIEVLQWSPDVKIVQRDHCEIYYCNVHDVLMRHDQVLHQDYRNYYRQIYHRLYLETGEILEQDVITMEPVERDDPPERRGRPQQLRIAV